MILQTIRVRVTALVLLPAFLVVGEVAGGTYQVPATAIDSGGGPVAGARYSIVGSLGLIAGVASSRTFEMRLGYPPQLEATFTPPTWVATHARATCLSLFMAPFWGEIQGEMNTNYVTTFDGRTSQPDTAVFSHELRPRAGAPGVYEADFVTYNSRGVLWQYGSYTSAQPLTDVDGNGILDALQVDQPGDYAVTGQSTPDYPTLPAASLEGRMHRAAGALAGTYEMTLRNAYGSVAYPGTFSLEYFDFQVSYQHGGNHVLRFERLLRASDLYTRLTGGDTTFIVTDADHLQLAAFQLNDSRGAAYQVLPATLRRSGNKYVGEMRLADGYLETPWPDYTQWVLEIVDTRDSDGNGIPDLSDLPTAVVVDTDNDGLPDDYERAHGFDPNDPADARGDADRDGLTNRDEYAIGTDPHDPLSTLKIQIEIRGPLCSLSFAAVSNRVYRLEYTGNLAAGPWRTLYAAQPGGTRVSVTDTNRDQRFYRLSAAPAP